jgi:hypothetical protein
MGMAKERLQHPHEMRGRVVNLDGAALAVG